MKNRSEDLIRECAHLNRAELMSLVAFLQPTPQETQAFLTQLRENSALKSPRPE